MRTETKTRKGIRGFNVLEDECIWMKAGVVQYRICDNGFDCNTCPYDKAMQKAVRAAGKSGAARPDWRQGLRTRHAQAPFPCRHALTGRAPAAKVCPNNYECAHCSYDQWLDEYDQARAEPSSGFERAGGFLLANGYYFHPNHGWARFEHGGRVRVGFDDFMVRLFGPMESLSVPRLGKKVFQNDPAFTFTRASHEAAVPMPLTGTVLAVNTHVVRNPDIAHKDPYNEGWLLMVEPDRPHKSLKQLVRGHDAAPWMEKEVRKLMGLMGPEYENLLATGAAPVDDIYGAVPELRWDMLAGAFLSPK